MTTTPARLIRFVDDDVLTTHHVCVFDPVKNLLRIRSAYYNVMPEHEQKIVWRATSTMTFQDVEAEVERRAGPFGRARTRAH